MTTVLRLAFVAFTFSIPFASGCGRGPLASTAEPRLVPWQLEADDAPPLVMGIYDRQERVHCRFVLDEAGQLRCQPPPEGALAGTETFADANCQRPVFRAYGGETAATLEGRWLSFFASSSPTTACAAPRYTAGKLARLATGAPLYKGPGCAIEGSVPSTEDGWVNLAVVETAPATRWAMGAEVDGWRLGGRLRLRQVVTDDGARFDDHLVDERWGQTCNLELALGDRDAVACWPFTGEDPSRLFGDAACAGSELWSVSSCGAPAFIGHEKGKLYALGADWNGPLFDEGGKGCFAAPDLFASDPDTRLVQRGAPLGADALADLKWQTGGSGRFRLRGLRGDAGEVVPLTDDLARTGQFVRYEDTVTGQGCSPLWTPEGLVRCVPMTVDVGLFELGAFADAACTTTAFVCSGANCAGRPVVRTHAAPDVLPYLGARADGLFSRRAPAAIFTKSASGCVAWPEVPADMFFVLGDALSWDLFPKLVERNGLPSGAP